MIRQENCILFRFFALVSQQKNSPEGILTENLSWQSTLDEFRTLDWRKIKTQFETSGLLSFWREKVQKEYRRESAIFAYA